MQVILIGLCFASISIFYRDLPLWGPGLDPFDDGKKIALMLCALLFASRWVAKRYDFFLGIACAVISIDWVIGQHMASMGFYMTAGSMIMLYVGHECAKRKEVSLRILRIVVWIQLLLGLIQLSGNATFQEIGANPWFGFYLPYGSIGNPTGLGAFLAIILPLSLMFWRWWESALILLVLLGTRSTMPVLSIAGALVFYLYKTKGLKFISPLLLLIPFFAVYAISHPEVEFFSFSGRFLPWSIAWNLIKENPWGYGIGSWLGLYNNWHVDYPRIWSFLHNDWLQLLFEGGIIPLLLVIVSSIRMLIRAELWAACSMFAMMINALGNFPFHLAAINFVFCLVLSIGIKDSSSLD